MNESKLRGHLWHMNLKSLNSLIIKKKSIAVQMKKIEKRPHVFYTSNNHMMPRFCLATILSEAH